MEKVKSVFTKEKISSMENYQKQKHFLEMSDCQDFDSTIEVKKISNHLSFASVKLLNDARVEEIKRAVAKNDDFGCRVYQFCSIYFWNFWTKEVLRVWKQILFNGILLQMFLVFEMDFDA